jgi:hypothetical protein
VLRSVQVVAQPVGEAQMRCPAQADGAPPGTHVPLPLHDPAGVSMPFWQEAPLPQLVPAAWKRHKPVPSHVPSRPQGFVVSAGQALSAMPALRGRHRPFAAPVEVEEQAMQVPVQPLSQQTPSTHAPLVQSEPALQVCPCAFVAVTQVPLVQVKPVLQAGVATLQHGWAEPPHATQLVPDFSVGEAQQAPLAQPRGQDIRAPRVHAPVLQVSTVQASLSTLQPVPSALAV